MLTTLIIEVINLLHEVVVVFSWAIPMTRKGGSYTIWIVKFFYLSRCGFPRRCFSLISPTSSSGPMTLVITAPVSRVNEDDPFPLADHDDSTGDALHTPATPPPSNSPPSSPHSSPSKSASSSTVPTPVTKIVVEELGPGKRKITPNVRLSDYVVGAAMITPFSSLSPSSPASQPSSGAVYPISEICPL